MFFGNNDYTIRLISAHYLTWNHREVAIPPKKSYALSYRTEGDCLFLTGGEEIHAHTGDVMYFPEGVGYRILAGKERLYSVNFEVEGEMPGEIMKMPIKKSAFFETAFAELYRAWSARESGYYARAMSYLFRIISELVREGEERTLTPAYARLKPAIAHIYSSIGDPSLSVSSLASYIGVSDTYFRRLFESEMGERPLDFINKVRISYAIEHLESGFYTIETIAEMCGFSDSKYFSTVFKRYQGMSPSEYIKKHS